MLYLVFSLENGKHHCFVDRLKKTKDPNQSLCIYRDFLSCESCVNKKAVSSGMMWKENKPKPQVLCGSDNKLNNQTQFYQGNEH